MKVSSCVKENWTVLMRTLENLTLEYQASKRFRIRDRLSLLNVHGFLQSVQANGEKRDFK